MCAPATFFSAQNRNRAACFAPSLIAGAIKKEAKPVKIALVGGRSSMTPRANEIARIVNIV